MNKFLLIALSLFLVSCATSDIKSVEKPKATTEEEPSIASRVYFLQHKLISEWLYDSKGAFYYDLQNGDVEQLIEAASEIVTPEYASEIVITPVTGREAVSIKFPEPDAIANCYYSLIKKDGDTFSYYTYEKTLDFEGETYGGVVGGWNSKGGHNNYGPRSYTSEEEFVKDVLDSNSVEDSLILGTTPRSRPR